MKRSLLTFSAWISLLLLTACRPPGIAVTGHKALSARESLMAGTSDKATFRAVVRFNEQELAGRMIVKRSGDGQYRVSFFNELGMTYFEAYSLPGKKGPVFMFRNVAPFIDRKPILRSAGKSLQAAFYGSGADAGSGNAVEERGSIVIRLRNGFVMELLAF